MSPAAEEVPTTPLDREQPAGVILGLRHDLLRATDRAVGAEAQLEHLQGRVRQLTKEVEQSASRVRKLTSERNKLRALVQAMHASTTWRVGRLVVGPTARLKRRRASR